MGPQRRSRQALRPRRRLRSGAPADLFRHGRGPSRDASCKASPRCSGGLCALRAATRIPSLPLIAARAVSSASWPMPCRRWVGTAAASPRGGRHLQQRRAAGCQTGRGPARALLPDPTLLRGRPRSAPMTDQPRVVTTSPSPATWLTATRPRGTWRRPRLPSAISVFLTTSKSARRWARSSIASSANPACRLPPSALAAHEHQSAIALLRERLTDPGFAPKLSALERAELELLAAAPQDFISCTARGAGEKEGLSGGVSEPASFVAYKIGPQRTYSTAISETSSSWFHTHLFEHRCSARPNEELKKIANRKLGCGLCSNTGRENGEVLNSKQELALPNRCSEFERFH